MKASGSALAVLLSLVAFATAPAVAAEDDFLYDPTTVNVIEITLPAAAIASLEADPFSYVAGGSVVITPTDGSPDGKGAPSKAFPNVEVKLKGKPGGSFEPLSGKAAFKLKVKKADAIYGLRKFTLNNMTQDPSQIHESLAYYAFRGAGIPASRAGYAYVYLSNKDTGERTDYGLHANVESLDTISLPKLFGAAFDSKTQHLYEANEYGADFYPGKESMFEVDEGDEANTADLTALIAAVDKADSNDEIDPLPVALTGRVDLAEMTRMWAAEKYIGHWDGYAGAGIPGEEGFNLHRPNNYYLYTDSKGAFSMLPWGVDQTWGPKPGSADPVAFDEQDGRLFDLCLEDEACSDQFVAAVESVRRALVPLCLGGRVEQTAEMLKPWQALEAAPPYDAEEVAAAVAATKEFVRSRPAEAVDFTGADLPFVPIEQCGVIPDPIPVEPSRPTADPLPGPSTPSPPKSAFSRLRLAKFAHGFRLTLRAELPGDAVLRGRTAIDGKLRQVCRAEARFDAPGNGVAVCRLSEAALAKLSRHALKVSFSAVFSPDSGAARRLSGRVVLPRH